MPTRDIFLQLFALTLIRHLPTAQFAIPLPFQRYDQLASTIHHHTLCCATMIPRREEQTPGATSYDIGDHSDPTQCLGIMSEETRRHARTAMALIFFF